MTNIHFVQNVVEMRQNIPVCPDVKTRKDPKTSKKAHGIISMITNGFVNLILFNFLFVMFCFYIYRIQVVFAVIKNFWSVTAL